jgi:hypothetical protein
MERVELPNTPLITADTIVSPAGITKLGNVPTVNGGGVVSELTKSNSPNVRVITTALAVKLSARKPATKKPNTALKPLIIISSSDYASSRRGKHDTRHRT